MGGQKPDWYERLDPNEKRIIDIFIETGWWFFIARPLFENRLCKTGVMNSKTLTDRFDYLVVEKRYLGKVRGSKGAVFYAPAFMSSIVLSDPMAKSLVIALIDSASPKEELAIPVPLKGICNRLTDEQESELLVRAAETWERVGVGSNRSKSKYYQTLRRRRNELKRKNELEQESEDGSP